MSESERPVPDRATSSEGCGRCREPLDASAHALMLCEACLGRHHAGCWTDGCATCGETHGLGPIGPLAQVSAPARVVAGIGARPTRVRRRRVAVVALVAVGAALLLVRSSPAVQPENVRQSGNLKTIGIAQHLFREGVAVESPTPTRDMEPTFHDAFALGERGDHAGAVELYSRLIEREPRNAAAWANRGYEREFLSDDEGALADYTHVLTDLDPEHVNVWANRGNVRRRQGDRAGAIADATRAIELAPSLIHAWAVRANTHADVGDFDAAISDARRALTLDPKNGTALKVIARAASAKDADAAWAAYFAVEPVDASGWCTRGFWRGVRGDHRGAVSDCSRALELEPGRAYAFNNRGYARMQLGDLEGASADLERSLELDPRNEYAWENRGNLRLMQGDHEGGIADFEQALAVDRRHERTDAIREALTRARAER